MGTGTASHALGDDFASPLPAVPLAPGPWPRLGWCRLAADVFICLVVGAGRQVRRSLVHFVSNHLWAPSAAACGLPRPVNHGPQPGAPSPDSLVPLRWKDGAVLAPNGVICYSWTHCHLLAHGQCWGRCTGPTGGLGAALIPGRVSGQVRAGCQGPRLRRSSARRSSVVPAEPGREAEAWYRAAPLEGVGGIRPRSPWL